jgi:hypothetical protein
VGAHTYPFCGHEDDMKGRDHSEDLGVDGKIILEWILEKQSDKVWIDAFV